MSPFALALLLACALFTGCGDEPSAGTDASATVHDLSFDDQRPDDAAPAPPSSQVVYVGGYAPQIAQLRLDPNGQLASVAVTAATGTPSFLALAPDRRHLYAVDEQNSRVEAFAIDPASGALTHLGVDVSSAGSGPAHLSVDGSGRWVLVANYTDGRIAVLPIQGDGSVGAVPATVNADCSANAHQFVTDANNAFAYVPCLADNTIRKYAFDATNGTLTQATPPSTPSGVGITQPRHLAFGSGGSVLFAIEESDSTIDVITAGGLTLLQRVSSLPSPSTTSKGAEVQVHPSGRFVYGSNRPSTGNGSIVAFDVGANQMLSNAAFFPTGDTPRHFTFDTTGQRLLVADQGQNGGAGDVRVSAVDGASGQLTSLSQLMLPHPSCVVVLALP